MIALRAILSIAVLLLTACSSAGSLGRNVSARVARLLLETPLVHGHNDLVLHFHACREGCPHGLSTYPRLFEELVRRGWSDADLAKLAGENFLRVLDAADAAVRRARESHGGT